MKMKYWVENEEPFFAVTYQKGEWKALEDKFKALGLKVAETKNGFGSGLNTAKFYRSSKSEFLRTLNMRSVIDDINESIVTSGYFNIGIFRFIPDSSGCVILKLNGFLTEPDCTMIRSKIIEFFDLFGRLSSGFDLEQNMVKMEEKRLNNFLREFEGEQHDNR